MDVLGYNIALDYPNLPIESKTIINTINPHSYCVAQKDEIFNKALKESDVLLPDGIGIVYATRILKRHKIEKIAGFDIFTFLMKRMNDIGGSCFFLGASQNTLNLIHQKIEEEYPNVRVSSYSPPYKASFTEEDSTMMIKQVNKHTPDVLFVGMTAPKQEKWVYEHKAKIEATIVCSIGAVFDFYAGTVKRPSKFWIQLGLEWLPRFIKEPKRLAERNLVSTPKFLLAVLKNKFSNKKNI